MLTRKFVCSIRHRRLVQSRKVKFTTIILHISSSKKKSSTCFVDNLLNVLWCHCLEVKQLLKCTMIRIQNVLQFIFKSIGFLETDISIVYIFKFSAPCTDVYDRCGVYISACGQSQFMRDYCKKTCGECAPPAPTGNCKQYKHTLEKRSWTSVQYVSSNCQNIYYTCNCIISTWTYVTEQNCYFDKNKYPTLFPFFFQKLESQWFLAEREYLTCLKCIW